MATVEDLLDTYTLAAGKLPAPGLLGQLPGVRENISKPDQPAWHTLPRHADGAAAAPLQPQEKYPLLGSNNDTHKYHQPIFYPP